MSLPTGVTKVGYKYRARIRKGKKVFVLGYFFTPEAAAKVFEDAHKRKKRRLLTYPKMSDLRETRKMIMRYVNQDARLEKRLDDALSRKFDG
jgi:hypothetical protein